MVLPGPLNFNNFVMLLLVVGLPARLSTAFSTLGRTNRSIRRTPIRRLFSSTAPLSGSNIEISPSNHETVALQDFTSSSSLDPRLLQALQAQGIVTPTPIQAHGIPLLQKGYDVMASSRTGSGKTLLFALPICERLLIDSTPANNNNTNTNNNNRGPSALILNPTRELALQTASSIQQLTSQIRQPPIKVALATGGASVQQQRQQVQQCDILVATPGRLLQFLDDRSLSLKGVQEVICDESDRMVDLGFEPQLRRIAQTLSRNNSQERRTVLCSATFPPEVQRVAADFLKADYYFFADGKVGATHTGIQQKLLWVDGPTTKRNVAIQEIQAFRNSNENKQQPQVIVFCNTKDEAENIGKGVQQTIKGSRVRVVTGDKTQEERNRFLDSFRKGQVDILVATDVAARGLDVPTIGLVVQVDTPRDVDTFVHRVGRTGRAGAKGRAVALVDGRSMGVAPDLVELLEEAEQDVPAWLLGMSHVSRARALEEQGAIAAGGGTLGGGSYSSTGGQSESTSDDTFSQQDFRSSADAGSWGAERDTSYHDFDDDAYKSLDADSVSMDVLEDESISAADTESTALSSDDVEMLDDQDTLISSSTPFKRQQPSRKLRETLKLLSGSEEIGDIDEPHANILRKLSERGSDQLTRFEYLGMFPFEGVSDFLMSKGKNEQASGDGNTIPTVLMVAEKPSIAKAIADALSGPRGPRQKRGISRALPVFEFNSNRFSPAQNIDEAGEGKNYMPCKIIVTSVVGHVFSLGFDQQENQGKNKDPAEYFRMPVVKQEEGSTGKLRVVDHLRALAADCDHLCLWLDCDAEGENIAHEVMGVTRRAMEQKVARDMQANPDTAPQRRVHRAQFSAITQEALRDAFENLVEPDAALSQSVDARQELDLRVGVALTRLLTWRCVGLARSKFSTTTKFISYGPCQTPALSFCVDRAAEIKNFVPEEYWKVDLTARASENKGDGPLKLRWIPPSGSSVATSRGGGRRGDKGEKVEESASFDKEAAQNIAKLASKPDAYATVVKVESDSEKINAPYGLNTVALLAAGSKAMGMSPKKVMQVAEKLYSAGLLSYPRTETTRYDPKGFDVRAVLREHASHPQWGKTAQFLLKTKYASSGRPPLRGKDAGDHPPITCLKSATREQVGGGSEWRVYEFVVRTFLGSLSDELVFTRQIAELEIGEDKLEIEQIQVDSVGFAGVCNWVLRDIGADSKGKNGEIKKPLVFREGMQLPIARANTERKRTRPPPFLLEHELIELMDSNRIGTDASMATHVTNIVDRGYVLLCDETGSPLRQWRPPRPGQQQPPRQIGRYMVPTSLGISLINLFKDHGGSLDETKESPSLLARPQIRAQMEEEVKQIANGKLGKDECVTQNLAWFQARYNELEESLSRQRINEFAKSLSPTNMSLKYWRKLGVFEEPRPKSPGQGNKKQGRGQGKKQGRYFAKSSGKPNSGQARRQGNKQNKTRNAKPKPKGRGPAKASYKARPQ